MTVGEAMEADAMGFTFLGMMPLSSSTIGMALVLNNLGGYKSAEFLKGFLGLHRLIEAMNHIWTQRSDNGTSHMCVVDGDQNAATLNCYFSSQIIPCVVRRELLEKLGSGIGEETSAVAQLRMPRNGIGPVNNADDVPVNDVLITNEADQTYFGCDIWRAFALEKGLRAGRRLWLYLQEEDHRRINMTYNDYA
ncbi:hypothetical protein ACQ4PT_065405 [Festuca glaucescens]